MEEYARKWIHNGANWKLRNSGNCSASPGKPHDAEQLPLEFSISASQPLKILIFCSQTKNLDREVL